MARGALIVYEGLDRAGKSTQCEKLVEALQKEGKKVRHLRFPGMCTSFFSHCMLVFGILIGIMHENWSQCRTRTKNP